MVHILLENEDYIPVIIYYTRQKKKRIQLHFPIFLKITINIVILFILFFSVLIE